MEGGRAQRGSPTPPSALLLDGPRALRDLLVYAGDEGAEGVVLHLNNLENLSEADAGRAADLLRGIRDQALLLDGLHLIVVGTTDAVRTVVQRHTQVRSVFSDPIVLEPLPLEQVQLLLEHRYDALRLDPALPRRPPVTAAVIAQLYELFRGDLRGMLKALEDGITALLGLAPGGQDAAPIDPEDLLMVLRQRNRGGAGGAAGRRPLGAAARMGRRRPGGGSHPGRTGGALGHQAAIGVPDPAGSDRGGSRRSPAPPGPGGDPLPAHRHRQAGAGGGVKLRAPAGW